MNNVSNTVSQSCPYNLPDHGCGPFALLPTNLVKDQIVGRLGARDLPSLMQVNRSFKQLCQSDEVCLKIAKKLGIRTRPPREADGVSRYEQMVRALGRSVTIENVTRAFPDNERRPTRVKEILEQPTRSRADQLELRDWLVARDRLVVWSALAREIAVKEPAAIEVKEPAAIEATDSLEEAQAKAAGLARWMTRHQAQLGAVTRLDLSNNRLTALPAEIWQLQALTRLYLGHNRLTALPAEIKNLQALTRLRLVGNRLTELPVEIGQLQALTELDLRATRLTELPAEIGNLQALTELSLGWNRLTALPAREIGQLQALTQLGLQYNRLTALPAEIGQLQALTELWLGGNQLTELPEGIERND